MHTHRQRQQYGAQRTCLCGLHGLREEDPQMCSVCAARNFYRAWNTLFTTSAGNDPHIVAPAIFVEVHGEKATGLVGRQRIDAQHAAPAQMRRHGHLIIWQILRVKAVRAPSLRFEANTLPPFVFACRTVPRTAVPALPPSSKYIRSSSKEGHEEGDLVRQRTSPGYPCLRRIDRSLDQSCLRRTFRYIDPMRLQQRPEHGVLCAQAVQLRHGMVCGGHDDPVSPSSRTSITLL